MLGLILGALAVGNAIYKGISGNQTKQRNKGYIEGNYQMAKQSLQKRQSDIRQSTNEQLAARGLAQGGLSPIARAMAANSGTYPDRPGVISQNDRVPPGGLGGTPHTLGEQQQVRQRRAVPARAGRPRAAAREGRAREQGRLHRHAGERGHERHPRRDAGRERREGARRDQRAPRRRLADQGDDDWHR
jgi:hypothetical protein